MRTADVTRLTRREAVLVGTAASMVALAPPALANDTLDAFMALSTRLTARTDLDPATGAAYLRALLSQPETATGLRALLDGSTGDAETTDAATRAVLTAWYTGVVSDTDERRVVAYETALMWGAVGFALPMGVCRSAVGSWSEPPPS